MMVAIRDCTIFGSPEPGKCRACKSVLSGRRTVWCSKACYRRFEIAHDWSFARSATIERDRDRCTKCGSKGIVTPKDREMFRSSLEVNHIVPVNGGVRHRTCLNHPDNLETVCRPCHKIITARQAAERALARRKAA